MKNEKPNYKLWANYEKIPLSAAAALLNGIEPQHDHLEIFKVGHGRIKRGESLNLTNKLEQPCKDYYHLNNNFWNISAQRMAHGGEEFRPLEIANKAFGLGLCDSDNEFYIAATKISKELNSSEIIQAQKIAVTPKEDTTLNLIGALATLYWEAKYPNQGKINRSAIKNAIEYKFKKIPGLSKRSLDTHLTKSLTSLENAMHELKESVT